MDKKAPLGSGKRFAAIENKVQAEGLSKEAAGAIAASAGRKAHGQAAMTRYAKMGKKRKDNEMEQYGKPPLLDKKKDGLALDDVCPPKGSTKYTTPANGKTIADKKKDDLGQNESKKMTKRPAKIIDDLYQNESKKSTKRPATIIEQTRDSLQQMESNKNKKAPSNFVGKQPYTSPVTKENYQAAVGPVKATKDPVKTFEGKAGSDPVRKAPKKGQDAKDCYAAQGRLVEDKKK
jgi:hypothetical protein